MRVLDLFSGIGGFSLGLERAGMQTVAFCEIDPFCRRVLKKHWPEVSCHDDITTRRFVEGEADIVCGGFPCQDISVAGAGAGLAGSRSGLWRELVRAIRVVRPRFAIVENVAALLGRGLGRVLGDLAEIGHDAEWHCIPASAVGAPHRRDRIWIVAHATSGGQRADGRAPRKGGHADFRSQALADSNGAGSHRLCGGEATALASAGECRGNASDANGQPIRQQQISECGGINTFEPGADVPYTTHHAALGDGIRRRDAAGQWRTEPDVGRVAHGVPARVDRLRSLGNAVVPQIPEIIGRAIIGAANQYSAVSP
jgi:DNA (cytosine-5)-methyltransferase 1